MSDDAEVFEDDGRSLAVVQAMKAKKALDAAPDLVAHLRARMLPADGRTEQGEFHRVERTPLLTTVTDAADEVFIVMLEWVDQWSEALDEPAPIAVHRAWRTAGGIRRTDPDVAAGFRAGTSPERAAGLVRILALWLNRHELAIGMDPLASDYREEIAAIVAKHRRLSGLDVARPIRETAPFPCPICDQKAVRVEYFGGSMYAAEMRGDLEADRIVAAASGITVRCAFCGHVEDTSLSKVVRWLVGAPVKNNRELQDIDAPFWTIEQTAKHLGLKRNTVTGYIRGGLPAYAAGTLLKPAEAIAEYLRRRDTLKRSQA